MQSRTRRRRKVSTLSSRSRGVVGSEFLPTLSILSQVLYASRSVGIVLSCSAKSQRGLPGVVAGLQSKPQVGAPLPHILPSRARHVGGNSGLAARGRGSGG